MDLINSSSLGRPEYVLLRHLIGLNFSSQEHSEEFLSVSYMSILLGFPSSSPKSLISSVIYHCPCSFSLNIVQFIHFFHAVWYVNMNFLLGGPLFRFEWLNICILFPGYLMHAEIPF